MARLFDGVDDQLHTDSPPVVAAPFTVALWIYPDSDTLTESFWGIGDKDTFDQHYVAQTAGTLAGDPIRYVARNAGTVDTLDTTTGFTAGVWNHFCAIERSAADRSVYVNGGGKTSGTLNVTPAGVDRMIVGADIELASAAFWAGRCAECAIWNVGLTDAEVLSLYTDRLLATSMRAANLIFYAPVCGENAPEPDITSGARNLTVTGATREAHPFVSIYCGSVTPPTRRGLASVN